MVQRGAAMILGAVGAVAAASYWLVPAGPAGSAETVLPQTVDTPAPVIAYGDAGQIKQVALSFEQAGILPVTFDKQGRKRTTTRPGSYAVQSGGAVFRSPETRTTVDGKARAVLCEETDKDEKANAWCVGQDGTSLTARSGAAFLALPTQASSQRLTRQEFFVAEEYLAPGDIVRLRYSIMLSAEMADLTDEPEKWQRQSQLAVGLDGCPAQNGNGMGVGHLLTLSLFRDKHGAARARVVGAQGPSAPSCLSKPERGQARRVLGASAPLTAEIWYDLDIEFRLDPYGRTAGDGLVFDGYVRVGLKPATSDTYDWFAIAGAPQHGAGIQLGWSKVPRQTARGPTRYSTRLGHYGRSSEREMALYFDEIVLERFGN